jgi:hypothetical protein
MDHWEFKEAVHNYKLKSGHAVNYYDNGPVNHSGSPYMGKRKDNGSVAKDKMRDVLGRSDSKSKVGSKRKNDLGLINDVK